MPLAGRLGLALPELVDAAAEGAVISDLFQPPHDTVDDVEPLCSACGGDCDYGCSGSGGRSFHPPTPSSNAAPAGDGQKRAFFGAGNSATAPASHSGSGFPHPGNGALSTRCECGDADCFIEGP